MAQRGIAKENTQLMTEGSYQKKLILFALPVMLGDLFQQLYNAIDSLIVGNFIGSSALAAVSSAGNLLFLIVGFFQGIAVGASVVVAQFIGARNAADTSKAVHTTEAFGLASSVIMTVLGLVFAPFALRLINTPADVLPESISYFRVYFAGVTGLVMYNTFVCIIRASGDSRHPLYYLVFSSVLNVVLDIVLIAGFHMDVEGAALATILSQFFSVFLCLRRLMTTEEDYRVQLRKIGYDWQMLKLIVRYGLPAGLQNSVIAIANVVVQSNINAFGTMAVAGCGAYSKIEGFAFLPITSFTIALTTFVGQNLGGREYERAKKGARFGVGCAILLSELIGLLTYLAAPTLIRAFTQEPEAIAFGVGKARICALFFCLLAASHGLSAVLRGAGKAVIPMISMLSFWCVVRVTILHFAVPVYQSIDVVNWVYPITWALSTVFLTVYYLRADWLHSFDRHAD